MFVFCYLMRCNTSLQRGRFCIRGTRFVAKEAKSLQERSRATGSRILWNAPETSFQSRRTFRLCNLFVNFILRWTLSHTFRRVMRKWPQMWGHWTVLVFHEVDMKKKKKKMPQTFVIFRGKVDGGRGFASVSILQIFTYGSCLFLWIAFHASNQFSNFDHSVLKKNLCVCVCLCTCVICRTYFAVASKYRSKRHVRIARRTVPKSSIRYGLDEGTPTPCRKWSLIYLAMW